MEEESPGVTALHHRDCLVPIAVQRESDGLPYKVPAFRSSFFTDLAMHPRDDLDEQSRSALRIAIKDQLRLAARES
jgi:hypothetical protein